MLLAGLLFVFTGAVKNAGAQEALRQSLAGETAATAKHEAAATIGYYNLLLGPVAWRFSSGLGVNYNDNIHLQQTNTQSDVIFSPNLETEIHWPVTENNSLDVALGIGYSAYMLHPEQDQLYINPGSGVAFDVFVGDFTIDFHDRITITENSYQNPTTGTNSSNNGNNARLENSAGVATTWDLNQMVVNFGYEHVNYAALSSGSSQPSSASENGYINAGVKVRPEITVGLEAGGTLTHNQLTDTNSTSGSPDSKQWSAGVFTRAQISEYMSAQLDAGYTMFSMAGIPMLVTNSPPGTNFIRLSSGNSMAYYFNFSLTHRVNRFLNYHLTVGRSTDLQFYGQPYDHYFAQLDPNWIILKDYQISTPFGWEHGQQLNGGQDSTFDQFRLGINISRQITKKLSGTVSYQWVKETDKTASLGYTVNIVGLNLSYQF